MKDEKSSSSIAINLDIQRIKAIEAECAHESGLPGYLMTDREKYEFPEFCANAEQNLLYIGARNHIIARWRRNVRKFISEEDATSLFKEHFLQSSKKIYRYLHRFGYINIGVLTENLPQNCKRNKKVIVIGAGFSGLLAATRLQLLGYEVLIVEARERVGGRVYTNRDGLGTPVDLGASIVTGTRGNPITTLCHQLNLKMHKIGEYGKIFDSTGEELDRDLDLTVEERFNTFLNDACQFKYSKDRKAIIQRAKKQNASFPFHIELSYSEAKTQTILESLSLGATLREIIEEHLSTIKDEEQKTREKRIFDWHVANLEYGCGNDLDPVSLIHWDQDDEFELGGKHCFMIDGYSSVAEKLAEYFGVQKIHFSSIVTKVETVGDVKKGTNRMQVSVASSKNSSATKVYEADYVLCTVPLGVLKEKKIEFIPPLPSWKTEAIELLGFGLLNKIVMRFPTMFWDSKLDYIGAVNDKDRGFCYIFWNLYPCCKEPVLTGLVAGKTAFDIENKNDKELVENAVEILRKLFKKENVPDPVSSIVTKWHSEEWSRGSYSFIGVNASGVHYDRMASPVYESSLFFSGEATSRCHPATVLGAVTSGIFAAGVIDKFDHATIEERQSLIEKQKQIEPIFDDSEQEEEEEKQEAQTADEETNQHKGYKRSVFSSRANSSSGNKRGNKEVVQQNEQEESNKKKKVEQKEEILSQGSIRPFGTTTFFPNNMIPTASNNQAFSNFFLALARSSNANNTVNNNNTQNK